MSNTNAKQERKTLALMTKYQVKVPLALLQSPHFAALRTPFAEKVAMVLAPMDTDRSEVALREGVRNLQESYRQASDACVSERRFGDKMLKLACQPGCNHCCHYRVTVKAPEVLLLAHYLRKRLSAEEIAALSQQLAEFDAEVSKLDVIGRGYRSLLCPLNVDSMCTVYPNRPLNCAACHSFSLEACLEDAESPGSAVPLDPDRRMLQALHGQGMEAALMALGLDYADLEFIPALRIALDDPDAGSKYLAGEPVFAAANQAELREDLVKEFDSRVLGPDQPAV